MGLSGHPKRSNQPYMPMYVGDWKKAPEINALSLAARGLWIEMLFLMWESTERGYLTINGVPITTEGLARQVGFACDLLEPLLAEMVRFGVFSVRDDGAMFCPRMVGGAEISQKRALAGKKGGICSSKRASKTQANADNDNDNDNNLLKDFKKLKEKESFKEVLVKGSKKDVMEEPETWKTSLDLYLSEERAAWETIMADRKWLAEVEALKKYPNLNIKKSFMKARIFWASEEGWKYKKEGKKTPEKINWKNTYANSLAQGINQVFDERTFQQQPGKTMDELYGDH